MASESSSLHKLPNITVVDGLSSDLIKTIVLFTWDNILGPKTLHIWTGEKQYVSPPTLAEDSTDICVTNLGKVLHSLPSDVAYDQRSPSSFSFSPKQYSTEASAASPPHAHSLGASSSIKSDLFFNSKTFWDLSEGKSAPLITSEPEGSDSPYLSFTDDNLAQDEDEIMTQEFLSYASRLILNGEICKDWDSGSIDRKFINITERGVMINAFTFAVGDEESGISIFSLALLMPSEELKLYLSRQKLISSWMERLTRKLGVILEIQKSPSSIATDAFTTYLEEFALMLTSIQEAGLPAKINLSDTMFQKAEFSPFLERAISSHIMTCGRSVVIGQKPSQVNKIIATLAMFNSTNERKSSRFLVKDRQWPYHHDICIQGLLKDAKHEINLPTEEIYCGEYPTSIIDMTSLEVRQSLPCHEHNFRRYEICKQEIVNLYTGASKGYNFQSSEKMFDLVQDPAAMISNLMIEVSCLCCEQHIIQAYIDHFMLLLHRKAVAFITFIESETNEGRLPLKTSVKSIRECLGMTVDGDFRMVLACAEKLTPGMFVYLYGDPKEKNDEMRRIIDNF